MKFNLKKYKKKIASLTFLAILIINITACIPFFSLKQLDLSYNKSNEKNRETREYPEEIRASTDFYSAERTINSGTQDYAFNDLFILNEDDFHDSVSFG